MTHAHDLLKAHAITSDQVDAKELAVILSELEKQLARGMAGSIVEFGCYIGTTSVFISRLLSQFNSSAPYHVFDSFEGLPAKTIHDNSAAGDHFTAGQLRATKKQFITHYKKAGLPLPVIHKGWFADVPARDVPPEIMFAFLDGDYYQSIKDSLRLITPHLVKGAVIIVDDYSSDALPGAARAVHEWVQAHECRMRAEASLAIITLP